MIIDKRGQHNPKMLALRNKKSEARHAVRFYKISCVKNKVI